VKVVSLIPSATEIVALLGAQDLLVGRSHECDFPQGLSGVPVLTGALVGSTPDQAADAARIHEDVVKSVEEGASLYRLDEQMLTELAPDLVITQDLCGVCSIDKGCVERVLERLGGSCELLSLDPRGIEDVLDDVTRVAAALGLEERGRHEVVSLRRRFEDAQICVNAYDDGPHVLMLEWTDPPFVGGHWNVQLVERAGGAHPLNPTRISHGYGAASGPQMAERLAGASIAVDPEKIVESAPEFVVVAPCGFTLDQSVQAAQSLAEQDWFRSLPAFAKGNVAVVDGNQMFNRPGPRIVDAYEFLVGFVQGREGLIPEGFPWVRLETR